MHLVAVAALWATGQAITAPPVRPLELREAVRLVSPPPRLIRPRTQPKARVRRFEMERAAVARTPEAIRVELQAPSVAVRTNPAPVMPQEPAIAVTSPAARPAGFAEVARATTARLELEPRAAAFGSALGRHEGPSVAPPDGTTSFGAAGLARTDSPAGAIGSGGFGGVEIGRAAQLTDLAGEAGFGAAAGRLAVVTAREPTFAKSRNQPVKILWKPVPKYSEEGIRRRIEGDVVLLVRFLALGTVETLQVVSALGYGLDEYAVQAAESIRFEPAMQGDQPVDYTAQVRIRFELAY
ncbi:MAG: TonB family protein [Acidobacteria bacterium]|nr:TonB family protein [Acidobacteriota bacterium]